MASQERAFRHKRHMVVNPGERPYPVALPPAASKHMKITLRNEKTFLVMCDQRCSSWLVWMDTRLVVLLV